MKHSIISLIMRGCGVIICSALLLHCPVKPIPDSSKTTCICLFIFLLYLAICSFVTYFNWEEYTGKCLVTCIISIIISIPLSIVSITTEHFICSGALFIVTIVSIGMEYTDIKE